MTNILQVNDEDMTNILQVNDEDMTNILQVNDEDMTNATHETAANKLKASGAKVDLLVKYNPEG